MPSACSSTEYVFEVSLTEIGDEFRDGTRDGYATVDEEDKLHDLIETRVAQVDLPANLGRTNSRLPSTERSTTPALF